MNRTFFLWLREAELVWAKEAETRDYARHPKGLQIKWMWEPLPDVDAEKEARGRTERLQNGTSCMRDECQGDWEEILEQQARERDKRQALGLPEPAYAASGPNEAAEEAARRQKEQEEDDRQAAEIRAQNRYRAAIAGVS
jgi:capsid protein